MHDILGHYNRFDIFDLKVNIKAQQSISLVESLSNDKNDIINLTS
jgi:aliphatic nitrilase